MGRTRRLSFGFTYGFMDMVDFFIEDCRKRLLVGEGPRVAPSMFGAKRFSAKETTRSRSPFVRTTSAYSKPILAIRISPTGSTSPAPGRPTRAAPHLPSTPSVGCSDAATAPKKRWPQLRGVTISCNWLVADRDGNIGYQQSGLLPGPSTLRAPPCSSVGGEVPLARTGARRPVAHTVLNPADGILVTANDDHNPPDGPLVINLPMGSYRADRIRALARRLLEVHPRGHETYPKRHLLVAGREVDGIF